MFVLLFEREGKRERKRKERRLIFQFNSQILGQVRPSNLTEISHLGGRVPTGTVTTTSLDALDYVVELGPQHRNSSVRL